MDFASPFSVLDGGMSTALELAGHDLGNPLWTAQLITTSPDAIVDAHLAYLRAGAEILISSSYQASIAGFMATGLDRTEAISAIGLTTELAREAIRRFRQESDEPADLLVAASVGPYGATLADGSEYHGEYPVGAGLLREFHLERLEILTASAPDLLACETIPSAAEALALGEALARIPTPPVWLSYSCRDGGHTSAGDRIEDAIAVACTIPGIVAVGVNCTAPEFVGSLLERAASVTALPLVAYANSGQTWNAIDCVWEGPTTPTDDAATLGRWLAAGARLVGGCCGVGPAGIAHLRAIRDGFRPPDLAA